MGTSEDLIGRWSVQKLELLEKYLAAYLTILSNQHWCAGYEYIDAFAGTGKPKTRDEQTYVDGSPRIALSLRPAFTEYHFVEQADWRVGRLEALKAEFPNRVIRIHPGDCNTILTEEILDHLAYASHKRAIAFLDPFGMQLRWKTMMAIASTETVEIMLNFPVMAINRGVLRQRPELISTADRARLEEFWGTKDWTVDFYEEERTFFGPEFVKKRLSGKEMGAVFCKRLGEIFRYCSEPLLMTNSRNAPLYCLIFAGHNATGVRIATDIFARHERGRK
jgi:three-Cys-motif partner protein